ncbi:hypothetical protein [uncultured Paludibaculum sp.]|uniref:hypothetical protein n=1 Tax=uncultured Paludibaculum sp. TaxID=1765020 RepID=UPI002AAB98D0|nr:hypothetical protein [uncultured Paludibaculum sp.]
MQHSNVNPQQFGKLYTLQVDGQVYAQPLYVSGVDVPGSGQRDLLLVATMHNSVYAFDAAAAPTDPPLWKVNLGPPVPTANYSVDYYYTDISPEAGILSTPVIDVSTRTLYVVASTYSERTYSFKLHALDLATGTPVAGSPATITASVQGTGSDNKDSVVSFVPSAHIQRPSLLLLNGVIYVGFGSHGDSGVYHGWLMGYSASNITQQVALLNTSPDGEAGSLWMAGHAPSVDEEGNIYVSTANGLWDGQRNFSQSILKLDGKLVVKDWFTPDNYQYLNDVDNDLGSSAPIPLPGTGLLIGGGKEGVLYVMKRGNLGQFGEGNPGVVQSFRAAPSGLFNMAYWNRPGAPLLFVQGFGAPVRAYQLKDGVFDTTPASEAVDAAGIPFQGMTVSSNQDDEQTAILWATSTDGGKVGRPWPGALHAYKAADLSQELWNSETVVGDTLPSFAKFASPTVANGRVYVPTFSNEVAVYGLRPGGSSGLKQIGAANALSMQSGAVSPGELVVILGSGIGPETPVGYKANGASTTELPQTLGGVQVLFDDQPASLVYVSSTKALAVVPYPVIGKSSVSVAVQYGGETTAPLTMDVVDAHPGIATADGSGVGAGAFENEDTTANSPENPAYPLTVISALVTGVGVTDPQNDSQGEPDAPYQLPLPKLPVTATIGGAEAKVLYAGGKPGLVGPVIWVRIQVPEEIEPGSAVPVVVRVGDYTSRAVTVSLAGDGALPLVTKRRVVNRQFGKQ